MRKHHQCVNILHIRLRLYFRQAWRAVGEKRGWVMDPWVAHVADRAATCMCPELTVIELAYVEREDSEEQGGQQ